MIKMQNTKQDRKGNITKTSSIQLNHQVQMNLTSSHLSVQLNLTKVPWQTKRRKQVSSLCLSDTFYCGVLKYILPEMIGNDRAFIMKNSVFNNSGMQEKER